ncbi:MAG: response regulator [Treponema sp.]|jgi:DNA-binding response OmpR family regulator|nr:response regulator [Treponema sp.]
MSGKKKILVVDDNEISLEIVKLMLKNDYEVITAKSGKTALEHLGHFRYGFIPDLILLDAMALFTGGWKIFREIKEIICSKKVPLILSAATKEIEWYKLAADIEVDEYIVKPYNKEDLLNKIRAVIEKQSKK